jgi:hypothetical protein
MKIFENIKNGLLPKREDIIELLKNDSKDKDEENREEIENYINILKEAYNKSDNLQEKILLNEEF